MVYHIGPSIFTAIIITLTRNFRHRHRHRRRQRYNCYPHRGTLIEILNTGFVAELATDVIWIILRMFSCHSGRHRRNDLASISSFSVTNRHSREVGKTFHQLVSSTLHFLSQLSTKYWETSSWNLKRKYEIRYSFDSALIGEFWNHSKIRSFKIHSKINYWQETNLVLVRLMGRWAGRTFVNARGHYKNLSSPGDVRKHKPQNIAKLYLST